MLCGALLVSSVACAPKRALPKNWAGAISTSGNAQADAAVSSTALTPSASSPRSAAPAPSASTASCELQRSSTLTEAAVRGLAQNWRLAQEHHDLSTYSEFYGEHFAGLVSRAGTFARLDRAAWLRAHESSLVLEPALARATVDIAIGAGGAQITFGGGRAESVSARLPELFVIPTPTGPKIVWEAPARARTVALSETVGPWLADEHFATLSATPEASWAEGDASYAGENSAVRAVSLARLPKAIRAWLGRPVRVLGANGAVCETRLQRFALRARITPDLPTAEVWEGCAEGTSQSPARIAADIWRLSRIGGRSLVAEFASPCKGALLAVDLNLPAPPIAAPEPAPAELGAAALQAFRKLPAYTALDERFKLENPTAEGAWEDHDARRSVWTVTLPTQPALVFVSVEAGAGCASFSGGLSALWRVDGSEHGAAPVLSLLSVPDAEDDHRLTPSAIVDFGDGPELLLGPDGLYAARSVLRAARRGTHDPGLAKGAPFARTLLSSVPFFAGPC
jgi:hypothetical protein